MCTRNSLKNMLRTNIFFLLGLWLVSMSSLQLKAQNKEFTNALIWNTPTFFPASAGSFESMKDGVHYTRLNRVEQKTELNKYQYSDGEKVSTLVPADVLPGKLTISRYQFSEDEKKVLLETEVEPIYRRSYLANYFVYDIEKEDLQKLTDFSKGKQRLADFSPKGDKIAFIRGNDIFIKDLASNTETQVTHDGKENHIINGYPDWVYEEEFGYNKAFHWSPDGTRIGYCRFDESNVKQFQMAMYGELYPEQYTFKYPKAGEENAKVTVHIYDVATAKTKNCNLPANKEYYIPRIAWTRKGHELCIMKMNRHQNHLEFLLADLSKDHPFDIELKRIFEEKSETYIEINDNLTFLSNGKEFLWNSARTGFNHLYLFDMSGKEVRAITSGKWEVTEFLGLDEEEGRVYYIAAEESPLEKAVFTVDLRGKKKRSLSAMPGNNKAQFSSSFAYFINTWSDANTPPVISLHDNKGKQIRALEDNRRLREAMSEYRISPKVFFTFKTERGDELNAWMIQPTGFNPNEKYPVLLNVYGGPGSNMVSNSWGGHNYLWHQMMAQQGYLVISVDPRGTMYRGNEFGHSTYLQLGKLETEDMISTAKYLATLPYVDSERIGIQGWSYGGYLSSLCMTKGAEYFKAGIAIAPVTNWRFYDTIYTERFMRTPQENEDGYDDNSPINHVDKLKGKYLLIHGAADDNVHYQNTMEMIDALVAADKQFDLFIYPNRNHGIYGGNTRNHLFERLSTWLKENL